MSGQQNLCLLFDFLVFFSPTTQPKKRNLGITSFGIQQAGPFVQCLCVRKAAHLLQ